MVNNEIYKVLEMFQQSLIISIIFLSIYSNQFWYKILRKLFLSSYFVYFGIQKFM